jgi:hypothetical protein
MSCPSLGRATLALSTVVAFFPAAAHAGIFLSSGFSAGNANVAKVDREHTQHWTWSVSEDVSIDGGVFWMKRGSNSNASVRFVVYEGAYASDFDDDDGDDGDDDSSNYLMDVSNAASTFATTYHWETFLTTPAIQLLAGRVYTAVLSSNASPSNSYTYRVNPGDGSPLEFRDQQGNSVSGPTVIPPTTLPGPGAIALLAAAGVAARRRRA